MKQKSLNWPTRALFHRRNALGGMRPAVQGAGLTIRCIYCNKKFRTPDAARQHERDYHEKMQESQEQSAQEEPFNGLFKR